MAYFTIPHRPTFGAPVFRSAYSASRNARASAASRPPSSHTMLFSPKRTCFRFAARTLRVQGSQGNPSGAAVPAPPFAPKRPFGTFRCCAWLFFRKEHMMLFSPKRSCFRFAALTLRVQGSQGNPSGAARQLPLHRGAKVTPQARSGLRRGARETLQALRASSPYTGEPR